MSPESETIISDASSVATKPTESELVSEQFTTASSLPIESNNSKPSNITHLQLDPNEEKEILHTLQDLHERFVSLIIKVKEVLKEKVHRGDLTIGTLTEFIQTYMHWENVEELNIIEDLNELFTKLHRYFDFLECGLIVAITKEYIQGQLATQLKQHKENALNLRRQQSIKNLKNGLRTFYTPHLQDTSNMPEVYIKLNDVWENADIEGLYLLVKCLLPKTKQQSLLEHITIDSGSVLIKYRVEESYVDYLIAYAENKPQFMRLIGIFGLVINNIPILQEDENRNFTFDSALLDSSQSGNNEAVQFLLDLGVNVNYSNSEGKTALMLACKAGHEEVVQTLVSAEANINLQDNAGQTALMLADRNVGIACRLLLANADPDLQRKDGNTALHIACYKRQSAIAELLLSFSATFVIPNTKGDTAFLAAARGNNTEILKLMLNSIPHSPFIVSLGVVYACRFGHSAVFNLFVKQLEYTAQIANFFISCAEGNVGSVIQHITEFNIDPNTTLVSGITPLMIASSFGNVDVLDCLLEAAGDVNSTDQDGYSPLAYAVTNNTSLHIVQCLLEAGANPNVLVGGVTILERAREEGGQTICDLLLKYSALHLYKRFIHLVDRIQEGIDTLIKGGKDILFQIIQQLEANFYLTGLTSEVPTSIALLNQLTPYYDFLHFEMLVMIVREFLKGDIENELQEYHEMVTKFEELVEIQQFKDIMSLIPQQEAMVSTTRTELTFKLNRQLSNRTLKSFRKLYTYLLSDNQKYLSHMTVDIIKVPYIRFMIPKSTQLVKNLIVNSEAVLEKTSYFMLGVFEMMIDNTSVLMEEEDKNFTFDSALLESSQSGNNEVVQFLLDLGVNINYTNSKGKTALILASKAGHEEVVQTLVSAGANVDLQDSKGQTALMLASEAGHEEIVQTLVSAGANVNLQDSVGQTALMLASEARYEEIVQTLVSAGANVNLQDSKGQTALMLASEARYEEIVQTLVSAGANVNLQDSKGQTALMLASEAGHEKVVQTLVSAGANVNLQDSKGQTALILARNVEILRCLLLAKADPDLQRKDGKTALHIACYDYQNTVVELLLIYRASPVIENINHDTPFMASVRGNNADILKLMIDAIPSSHLSSGIVLACRLGHSAVFSLLVKQLECTPQVIDLFISCAEGDVGSVIQHIVKFNIDPNTTLILGITPLMIASSFWNADVLKCLLEAGADVNSNDQDGYSPLTYAITGNSSFHIVQCLLEAEANPNILAGGVTIVERAREKGEQAICDLLLKYSALHLYKRFIHLVDRIQEGIDTLIKGGKYTLLQITKQLEVHFHLTGLTSKIVTSIALLNQLTPYYDFLHFEMLVVIVREFLKGDIENELQEYHKMATKFEETVEIQQFSDVLSLVPQQEVMSSTTCTELTFKLNRQWSSLTLKSFHRLYSYFSDYQTYPSHMTVDVVEEVLYIKFLTPNFIQGVDLVSVKPNKKQSACFLGVIQMTMDDESILTVVQNKNFTFDSALLESSQSGNNEAVQFLLDLGVNVNYSNSEGTALMLASEAGREEVVRTLISAGANINLQDKDGCTALMVSKTKEIFSLLLQSNADINILTHKGSTPLIVASDLGCLSVVESLLREHNNDPNVQNEGGSTALIIASWYSRFQVVEILLKNGADPNIHDNDGSTALLIASLNGHYQIVEILLKNGADPNIRNNDGYTAVMVSKTKEIFSLLLQFNADINILTNNGTTPLIVASSDPECLSIVETLLREYNNDPNVQNEGGSTALMRAAYWNAYQVVEILLKYGGNPNIHNNNGWTALINAAQNGHQQILELLLEKHVDPNVQNSENGTTALIQASRNCHYQVIKILLKEGADPNIPDKNGLTALMVAFYRGRYQVMKILLKKGADPNIPDKNGLTALMVATHISHFQVVKLLLKEGADPNIQNEDGMTALIIATFKGRADIIKVLLRYNANPGEVSFALAAMKCNIECLNIFLKHSEFSLKTISMSWNFACYHGHVPIITLLSTRLDITSHQTDLIISCAKGDLKSVLNQLMYSTMTPDVEFVHGVTPLMILSSCGHTDIVEALITAGANVNKTDEFGRTALDYAKANDDDFFRRKTIKHILLQHGGIKGSHMKGESHEDPLPQRFGKDETIPELSSTDNSKSTKSHQDSLLTKKEFDPTKGSFSDDILNAWNEYINSTDNPTINQNLNITRAFKEIQHISSFDCKDNHLSF